ncbi:MAG: hypothetical protein WBS54_15790 [Acidobacteriota bacterium]
MRGEPTVGKGAKNTGGTSDSEMLDSPTTDLASLLQKAFMQIAESAQKAFAQHIEDIKREIEKFELTWRNIAAETKEWYQALPEINRFVFQGICKRGWYPSGKMSASMVNRMARLLQADDSDGLDREMAAFVGKHERSIQEALLRKFPTRAKVLRAAFTAHKQRRYSLAIPVFLAQADGICLDRLGVKLFSVNPRTLKPRTASKIPGGETNPFTASLLSPLEVVGGLGMCRDEVARLNPPLNRHEVLHGLALNYGTRLNSFRCISLLDFLQSIVAPNERVQPGPSEKGH